MVREFEQKQMEQNMKVIGLKVLDKEKVYINIQMEYIKVNLKITKRMDLVLLFFKINKNTKEIGLIKINTVKEFIPSPMGVKKKEYGKMEKT